MVTDVSDSSRMMQEEIFGPITCIVPFKTEEEVKEVMNITQPKSYIYIYIWLQLKNRATSLRPPHTQCYFVACSRF